MEEKTHKPVRYGVYAAVWAALLALTWITVESSRIQLGRWHTAVPLLIASGKALLVLAFFMHLKYEKSFFRIMIAIALATMAVVGWLAHADFGYRGQ